MKIDDYSTYLYRPEDAPYLNTKLLDVSIRLFNINQDYKNIVLNVCNYMLRVLGHQYDDYPTLHGISGANLAIPFNIIGYNLNGNSHIMINPRITEMSGEEIGTSNCGSVRLKEPIEVSRKALIRVEFYDLDGKRHNEYFGRKDGAMTIQHEIDHNQGIVILDRKVKNAIKS